MISISTLQCGIEGCHSLGSKSGKNGTHVVLPPGPTLIWFDIWSLILHWHVVTDNWQPIFNLNFKKKKLILLIKKKFYINKTLQPCVAYKMGLTELCLAPQRHKPQSQQIHILIILNYVFCLRNIIWLSVYHKGTT